MPQPTSVSKFAANPAFFSKWLLIGVLVVDLFVVALAMLGLAQDREQRQEHTRTNTRNLAHVLEEHVNGVINKVDLALLTVVDEHARQSATGSIDGDAMNRLLAKQLAHIPELLSLRIADAQGVVKYGPGVESGAPVNNADRDYFIAARDVAEDGLVVSKPLFARISKKWAITLARPLKGKGGVFEGVVYVNVALESLSKTFSRIDIGKQGFIGLRDTEMGLITRHPLPPNFAEAVGSKVVSNEIRELVAKGQTTGTYLARAGIDNIERIISFRRFTGQPFYIFVGISTEDYLADWRADIVRVALLVGVFLLITWIAAWTIRRDWRRQFAAAEKLAEQEAKFRTVADNTYDWEYWQGPNQEIRYMTPSCERITGYSVAEFSADPGLIDRIIHPDDAHLWHGHGADCAGTIDSTLDFRIVRKDGQIRWVAHGCQAVFGADGQTLGRRASNRDITERKNSEASEARLRTSLRHLSEVSALTHLSLNEQFHQALAIGAAHLKLEMGIVSHIENDVYEVVAQVSPPDTLRDGMTFNYGLTYCSITLDKGSVLAIPDMGHSPYLGHPCYQEFKLETYIGAPIMVNGRAYGTVNFSSLRPYPRAFDEGDQEFIALLARWAGSALEREQATQLLAENRRFLETIVENEPECVKLLARDGTLLQMNRAGLNMIEADSPDQAVGRLIQPVIAPAFRNEFMALTRRVFKGESGNLEFELCGLKGTRRWLDTHAVPLRDAEGKVTALLAVTRDITERKRAEEMLRRSKEQFDAILNATTESIFLVDGSGIVLAVNPTGAQRLGHTPEALLGKCIFEFFPPDVATARRPVMEEVMLTGKAKYIEDSRNGRHFSQFYYPVTDHNGEATAIVVFAIDITARRRAEEALHQLNATLDLRVKAEVSKNMEQERLLIQQSRLAAMGEMIGNIAHQWRQPINAIGLLLANIKDSYEYGELTAAEVDRQVEIGRRLVSKMSETIDDFRNFFKPNKEKAAFSLKQAVDETLEILAASLRNHNIQVKVEGDAEVVGYGFPNEYAQVLLNLLNNAKEAILNRDIENGAISIHITHRDGQACLVVSDNGGGIAEDHLAKIFDPYFTTKEKGTGIGLYMSKLIIEDNMSGKIAARNIDNGAEFTITCPLAGESS